MSEFFGTTATWLAQTVLVLNEERDRQNSRAYFNYKVAHDNWLLNRSFQPTPPAVPGTWTIVSKQEVIDGITYVVPNDNLVYREDLPLCEALPIPASPSIGQLPEIGEPFYTNYSKGPRHIIGRALMEQNGATDNLLVDGELVEYVLKVTPSPMGRGVNYAYWEPK